MIDQPDQPDGPDQPDRPDRPDQSDSLAEADALAARLKDAHGRVRRLDLPPEDRARVARRLIALTDASKHDIARASARLDRLLADLDAGRVPRPD